LSFVVQTCINFKTRIFFSATRNSGFKILPRRNTSREAGAVVRQGGFQEWRAKETFQEIVTKYQGRTKVKWRPGQETSLAPPCSNLKSFERKCAVLRKVLETLMRLFGAGGIV